MNRNTWMIGVLLAGTAASACKKNEPTATEQPSTGSAAVGSAAAGSAAVGSGAADPAADAGAAAGSGSAEGAGAAAASAFDPGTLATPESVLYDEGRDMYMVSNINGKVTDADDNGYLSVVNPDGSNDRAAANWPWINGVAGDIKLDAPKGMAISGDTLFVADITVVRQFEAKAGRQKPDIAIAGATFLNDVAPDGDGGVFVSDTGVDGSFQPTGTDAIYHITKDGKLTTRIKGKELGGPNGVWAGDKGSVWVVTWTGEIYQVDAKGKKRPGHKLPKGQLDGIVGLPGGEFLVSSWEGKAVYRGKPGGVWTEVVSGIESPADIAYDPKRKRLLIPVFMGNAVVVHPLE